jgi:hypothetical protein
MSSTCTATASRRGRGEGLGRAHPLGDEPWVWQPSPVDLEIIVGNRGMGKSHAARVRTANVRRLLCWDPMRDEDDLGAGRVTVNQLEKLEQYFAGHPLQRGLFQGVLRLAVRPVRWSGQDLVDEIERFSRVAYRIGGLCAKLDELGAVVNAPRPPPGDLLRLIAEGRHRAVSLVLVAQRFAQVPVLARDNATRIICFRQAGPDDADDLVDRVGELGARVRSLPERHFLEWTPTGGAQLRPPLGT